MNKCDRIKRDLSTQISDFCVAYLWSTANVPALILCTPSRTARLPSSAAITNGDDLQAVSPDGDVVRCCSKSRAVISYWSQNANREYKKCNQAIITEYTEKETTSANTETMKRSAVHSSYFFGYSRMHKYNNVKEALTSARSLQAIQKITQWCLESLSAQVPSMDSYILTGRSVNLPNNAEKHQKSIPYLLASNAGF